MRSTTPNIKSFVQLLLSDERANWSLTGASNLYYIYYGRLRRLGVPTVVTADQVRSEWTEYNCYNAAIADLGNIDKMWYYTLPNGHVLVHVGN